VDEDWAYVDTTASSYTWQRLEAATGDVVEEAGTGTIASFTSAHGNGPGYLLAGLGCNGNDFSIDALSYGRAGAVTTYDLEAFTTTVSIGPEQVPDVVAGDEVTITGSAVASGVDVGAPLVLQARTDPSKPFKRVGEPVEVDTDGVARATVKPKVTTTYRWYLPDLGYAGGVYSDRLTVIVLPPAGEEPTSEPTEDSSEGAGSAPSSGAGADQGAPAETDVPELPPIPSQADETEPPAEEQTEPPAEEPAEPEATEPTEPAQETAPADATDAESADATP
jgi:hypothetical protein